MEFVVHDSEPQEKKVGTYDWIVEGEELLALLRRVLGDLALFPCMCVLGCGTSTLSEDLQRESGAEVMSVDNDVHCLQHMTSRFASNPKLRWAYCDLTETKGAALDAVMAVGPFDLVVDKGTFDAILVEGSSWELLATAYRLLKFDGIFVLCSLHGPDLLAPLLATPALNMQATLHPIGRGNTSGTVAICRKSTAVPDFTPLNEAALQQEEQHIMDEYYKHQHPLMSHEKEVLLRATFAATQQHHVPIDTVYAMVFDGDGALGYSMELFREDLVDFALSMEGHMSVDEVIAFIREKQ